MATTDADPAKCSTVLDCSSVDSAAGSLCGLLALSRPDLDWKIANADIDWDDTETTAGDQILLQLGVDPQEPPRPSAIRWFHATRVLPCISFVDGLLPTAAALPKIWTALGAAAAHWLADHEWAQYRESFSRSNRPAARQFRAKQAVANFGGPFAFLTRDAALHKHGAHKDFTRLPETMEDICADFEGVYKHPLRRSYEELSRPCLVVFTAPGAWPGAVRTAANYVFRTIRKIECGLHCNTNFNGKGECVSSACIDYIEWP